MPRTSARRVLAALAAAGESGLLSGEVATQLDVRDDSYEARQVRQGNTNNILGRQLALGLVRKAPHKERGASTYNGIPSYRWFITDIGRTALEVPVPATYRERAEERRQQRQARQARSRQLIAEAFEAGYGPETPQCQKITKIHELRSQGVLLAEIGVLFSLTRERVRQLEKGIRVTPCQCSACLRSRMIELAQ